MKDNGPWGGGHKLEENGSHKIDELWDGFFVESQYVPDVLREVVSEIDRLKERILVLERKTKQHEKD